jgi:hypothetical protein
MNEARVIARQKVWTNTLVQTLVFVGLVSIAPLFPLQGIAGPIVNALLYIAVIFLGVRYALFVCIFPSIISLSTGLLPVVLAPMIPFIILGNIILVLLFAYFKEKSYWLGVVVASVAKFIFIFAASQVIIDKFLPSNIAPAIANMMSWPQLFTALLGGVIAYAFLKFIKKI